MSTFRIANHLLTIEGDQERECLLAMPGLSVFEEDTAKREWSVHYGCQWNVLNLNNKKRLLYEFELTDSNIHCQFYREKEIYYLTMQLKGNECNPFLMRYNIGTMLVEATATDNRAMLQFSLWFAFALFSCFCNSTLVHAATVVCEGFATLFLGESGTGKSTHARLWLKHIGGTQLLNDDSPVIVKEGGRWMVYGSPWSGKTGCYYNQGYPIKAIVRLSQAEYNSIHLLRPLEAAVALLPSFPPALLQDEYLSDRFFSLVSDVVKDISIYRLECLPDVLAAELCYNTIYM